MRYKLFGKSGLRVSELCLGTMTFGTAWGSGTDYEGSKAIFDTFAKAGGNFLDTANRYTEGTSEKYLGDFIASDREHFVVATKYSLYEKRGEVNANGNHRKNMVYTVNQSLKRLKTDYIDLLWLHAWDFTTPQDEILRSLNDLIRSGKVHYIGISDTAAWQVAQMNQFAELQAWDRFVGLQIEYSLLQRTPERDLLPMAKHWDMAVTPWGAIGGGALTGKYLTETDEPKRLSADSKRLNERSTKIAREVVAVAKELGVTPVQVAINWTRQGKGQVVIPIIGARRQSQLEDSLGCLSFELPQAQIDRLNEVSAIELGFPHDFLSSDHVHDVIFGGTFDKIDNHRL
ncbi:MAG: aldo/keto reductase [Saprospiraceae bacterium]|nr:aldo/keto reductase [Saprospiraceae bacterium]